MRAEVNLGNYPNVDEAILETKCFKSVWVSVVLQELTFSSIKSSPNTVDGKVAHWTVGALLHRTMRTRYLKKCISISVVEGKISFVVKHLSFQSVRK